MVTFSMTVYAVLTAAAMVVLAIQIISLYRYAKKRVGDVAYHVSTLLLWAMFFGLGVHNIALESYLAGCLQLVSAIVEFLILMAGYTFLGKFWKSIGDNDDPYGFLILVVESPDKDAERETEQEQEQEAE